MLPQLLSIIWIYIFHIFMILLSFEVDRANFLMAVMVRQKALQAKEVILGLLNSLDTNYFI